LGRCSHAIRVARIVLFENRGKGRGSAISRRLAWTSLKRPFNEFVLQSKLMVRKDSEKDSERPHYYSQFWLDIAAGRKTIGGPRANDEADVIEPELDEPVQLRRPARNSSPQHYEAPIVHPDVEPMDEDEDEFEEPMPDDLGMDEEELDEAGIPNIVVEETEPDLAPVVEELIAEPSEEEEEYYDDDEEEEEEEEEEGWSGRGRKKPKGRQTRLPAKKPTRRDRRGPGF
jgi:hypothetical protein